MKQKRTQTIEDKISIERKSIKAENTLSETLKDKKIKKCIKYRQPQHTQTLFARQMKQYDATKPTQYWSKPIELKEK